MMFCNQAVILSLLLSTIFKMEATECKSSIESNSHFSVNVEAFLTPDLEKINSNIFEAFNNNPISFTDNSGKAPENATQILTRTYGAQRTLNYQLFDLANENVDLLGQVNRNNIPMYNTVNSGTEGQIARNIRRLNLPPGYQINEFASEVYRSGIRRNFPVAERRFHVSSEGGHLRGEYRTHISNQYDRVTDFGPRTNPAQHLRYQAMEQHLEATGVGRQIFDEEEATWSRMVGSFGPLYVPSILGQRALDLGLGYLTADEWATLYSSPNYLYTDRLTAYVNYQELRRNLLPNNMTQDTQMVYQNYRRRFVTIRGINNTHATVPFRRITLPE